MSTEDARRDARKQLAESRFAEPSVRGGEEIKRGGEEIKRGGEEIKRGGMVGDDDARYQAMDIFRRATNLGGHLVVAFVTPIGSPRALFGGRTGLKFLTAQSEAVEANSVVNDFVELVKRRRLQLAQSMQPGLPVGVAPKPPKPPHWQVSGS